MSGIKLRICFDTWICLHRNRCSILFLFFEKSIFLSKRSFISGRKKVRGKITLDCINHINCLTYSIPQLTVKTRKSSGKMSNPMSLCCFNAVPRITSLSRRTARTKTERKEKPTNGSNSLGFGRERRDPLWQCVQGCGACCKLDKGPNFLSPEEIFNDPSDVQVSFPLWYLVQYLFDKMTTL